MMRRDVLPLFMWTSDFTIIFRQRQKTLITDKMWGIYYKPDICESLGVQGGAAPYKVT